MYNFECRHFLGNKENIYDTEQLDDEALALILRPEKQIKVTTTAQVNHASGLQARLAPQLTTTVTSSIFDQAHPNCLTFSDNGRLFVGDNRGTIGAWDISLRHGNLIVENHFKITNKELEGDEINSIKVHPEHTNQLVVHSRDNCIRMVEYESSRGPRVRHRFFGAKCKDLMVQSCVSPDGQFVISGSEDGRPRIWDTTLEQSYNPQQYEC